MLDVREQTRIQGTPHLSSSFAVFEKRGACSIKISPNAVLCVEKSPVPLADTGPASCTLAAASLGCLIWTMSPSTPHRVALRNMGLKTQLCGQGTCNLPTKDLLSKDESPRTAFISELFPL